ncbi:ATP-binding protein [Sphingobacterium sp.]|uniref:NACHT domain-containing protein n=1 Tax=Sphingobacterium sp. TaxID=341027 RepID=UPI00289B8825|nr:ATP-binding protein [Sphingobacterium sp.]
MIEWEYLAKQYKIEGARSRFEEVCTAVLIRKFPERNVKSPQSSSGDGGIDIFIGDLGTAKADIFQCKFFLNRLGPSQKQQIGSSFRKVILADNFTASNWTLCLPIQLTKEEHIWWAQWKQRQEVEFDLGTGFIRLMDGLQLLEELKQHGLYDQVFDEQVKQDIKLILERTAAKDFNLEIELARASNFLGELKNYFSNNSQTHLKRKQTLQVLEWIASEPKGEQILGNVLVIKGRKGVGKSTIISDTYHQLINENNQHVLAIKCDQFYDTNAEDLAKQLFSTGISFEDIFSKATDSGKQTVILLDQLDALSQTLSTDRRWLKTYLSLIDYLLEKRNVKIILSTRTFDLDYDADLIRFNDLQRIKHIEVDLLSPEEVSSVLRTLTINIKNNTLLELLRVPYNLELFTKIPDLDSLLGNSTEINVSRLHAELYSQVLKARHLKIIDCLELIVQRMYSNLPNMIEERYLEAFSSEIDYLISHGILIRHGAKLSFFHQSFYEYYLARWFVDTKRDLVTYIFEQEQNLYIRSLIKNVIDYLREADHTKYISLYKNILSDKKIRYHILYLFITTLGQVEQPSEKEQQMVYEMLHSEHGALFGEVFNSPGWMEFLMENDLLPKGTNELYAILHRNLNAFPEKILNFIECSALPNQENLIANLLYSIKEWTVGLLPYFEKYYPYSENNELWYFEMLKKIAVIDFKFVLEKLKPIFVAQRKEKERLKFDYRYDRIVEHLFKIDPRSTAEFLLNVQINILEGTQNAYYREYDEINSPLLSSSHYDRGLRYKDEADEKSLESFLLRYYRTCERTELLDLYQNQKNSNYVVLICLLIKLLRDRAEEFIDEIFELIEIIDQKNGLKGWDDFFSLQVRRLISRSIQLFNKGQYQAIKVLLLNLNSPREIYIWTFEDGKRRLISNLGKKKYLFLKGLPSEVLKMDQKIRRSYLELQRKFGEINHNIAMEASGMRWGGGQSPLNNPHFDKFNHQAWLSSMRKIHEGYKHEDFMRGDILEHGRSFEKAVEQNPEYFYDFIDKLFNQDGISPKYISHGISGLISAKNNIPKTAELIKKEIRLSYDREYTQYAVWHSVFLIKHNLVTQEIVEFWVKVAKWEPHENDRLNPGHEISDFINTPRGTAIDNLMHLGAFPEYSEMVFETIEYILRPGQVPTKTLSCGIMTNIAYLNQLNLNRSFEIFKTLIAYNDLDILKYSINTAQYYNNTFHYQMGFYFDQVLKHRELYKNGYFFVSSWIFERIDDYPLYDKFMKLGGDVLKCAITVAEKLLVGENGIDKRSIQVLERCLAQDSEDLSHEFSGLVLRKFKTNQFLELYSFIEKYITTRHFAKDPRYLFEYLTECTASYPCECLKLLGKMNLPFEVDMRETAYMGDEPLILLLAIYSKLRSLKFKYATEQKRALDEFDRMLKIPAIRIKALEAMENVLN